MKIKSLLLAVIVIVICSQSCTKEEIISEDNILITNSTKRLLTVDVNGEQVPAKICYKPLYVVYEMGTKLLTKQRQANTIGVATYGEFFYYEPSSCSDVDIWYIPYLIPETSNCTIFTTDRLDQAVVVLDAEDIDEEDEAEETSIILLSGGPSGGLVLPGSVNGEEVFFTAFTCEEAKELVYANNLQTGPSGLSIGNNNNNRPNPLGGIPIE